MITEAAGPDISEEVCCAVHTQLGSGALYSLDPVRCYYQPGTSDQLIFFRPGIPLPRLRAKQEAVSLSGVWDWGSVD